MNANNFFDFKKYYEDVEKTESREILNNIKQLLMK